ncbi:Tim44 domain-containing protein [Bdellovibrionota bacterium FG-1]
MNFSKKKTSPGFLPRASIIATLLMVACFSPDASARAGGGRSFGSRGSRTYSAPSRSLSQPSRPAAPYQQAQPQQNQPFSQPSQPMGGGGFLRNMAGGLVGGMVGSMLFRSLGMGGGWGAGQGGGGGGIGLLEILLLGGLIFVIFRIFRSRRTEPDSSYSTPLHSVLTYSAPESISRPEMAFDSAGLKEIAQDLFFKVQGAWTRGDLSLVKNRVSPETLGVLQQDLDSLKSRREVNRLENIAVRDVEITESWQDAGSDYVTVRFLANLLDYNTDETGKVVSGSDADPVKFEEYWTFVRTGGAAGSWVLSAISQSAV